ncbi:MAG: hypothetical protein K0S46_1895 [Moraxellaceae bacterium]|jgi:hypothetical protein|nr:hypothetical protein [Moraxellaceae bacterium]
MPNPPNFHVSVRSEDRLAEPGTSYAAEDQAQRVVVTDFKMPFWSMTWFMVK